MVFGFPGDPFSASGTEQVISKNIYLRKSLDTTLSYGILFSYDNVVQSRFEPSVEFCRIFNHFSGSEFMSKKITKLSPGEAELLELFWDYGELTLPKAYELYLQQGSSRPSYSTIQTRLNRMVEKELLHRSEDFPAVYTTRISREQAQGKYFELLDRLAGKNFAPLMIHLSENRSLSPEEIATMKSILAKIETEKGRKTGNLNPQIPGGES